MMLLCFSGFLSNQRPQKHQYLIAIKTQYCSNCLLLKLFNWLIAAIVFKKKRKPWEEFSCLCTVYFYIILVAGLETNHLLMIIAVNMITLVNIVIMDCKLEIYQIHNDWWITTCGVEWTTEALQATSSPHSFVLCC